jgi:hypothetical protein
MVIFDILVHFNNIGTNIQDFHKPNFGFNSNLLSFFIPLKYSKVLNCQHIL